MTKLTGRLVTPPVRGPHFTSAEWLLIEGALADHVDTLDCDMRMCLPQYVEQLKERADRTQALLEKVKHERMKVSLQEDQDWSAP